jgi:hypothetical protein
MVIETKMKGAAAKGSGGEIFERMFCATKRMLK